MTNIKRHYIYQENKRVLRTANYLRNQNLEEFGKVLYEGHEGAKSQFKISCVELYFLIEKSQENLNILGSRMMEEVLESAH